MKNKTPYETVRDTLVPYLYQYLSKPNLRMKGVMRGLIKSLKSYRPLTQNQLNSVIKFVEREKEFVMLDRDEIFDYFSPLMTDPKKETTNVNDLTEFFV